MGNRALSARITGVVQGLGFRDWTATEARARGIASWDRNEDDGSVAALFHGPPKPWRR
jgi:acylphosphatase